jgi:hypothetical protein
LSPPVILSKKRKTPDKSSSPSGVTQKLSIPQEKFVQPEKPALELLKQLYPDMIPNIRNASAKIFTDAMNDLRALKRFKKYKINSAGWDLFLACINRETHEDVHKRFFQDLSIKCNKEKFATWFTGVKSSVEKITKYSLKSAIRTRALERMRDYFSESEDSEIPVESELESVENESSDDEVTDKNAHCFFSILLST